MKVLLVNTSDQAGGAAVACRRLMEALADDGVEVRMLVRDKSTSDSRIATVKAPWQKAVERLLLLPFMGFSWKRSWGIDTNILGADITATEAFQWADVVHLHWVNQGMISMRELEKIVRSGKKVVWTMHDAWCSTGGCHLTLDCEHYKTGCRDCSLVSKPFGNALIHRSWQQKSHLYEHAHIHFTSCSNWLRSNAKASLLMKDQKICVIPNPIDGRIFHKTDKTAARQQLNLPADRRLILFVAQYISNPYKGVRYLVDAINMLSQGKDCGNLGVMIMGSRGESIAQLIKDVPVYDLGYQTSPHDIARIYNAADVFVLPSLSENLPNTIMEAMACGVPSVGFNIGGIPEMIDHMENGYVAEARNVNLLAEGITYCLNEANQQRLSDACISKVADNYSQKAVSKRFIQIYSE